MKLVSISIFVLFLACKTQHTRIAPLDIIHSECLLDSLSEYDIDQIISSQQKELQDSVLVENFKTMIEEKISFLTAAKGNKSQLFPNQEIDSAVYIGGYALNEENLTDFRLETRNPGFATILCKEKITAMIHFMNNPSNFAYGECGTPIPEAQIIFFQKGKQVAKIVFACSHAQISSEPNTPLTNWGLLSDIGNEKLDEIKPWK